MAGDRHLSVAEREPFTIVSGHDTVNFNNPGTSVSSASTLGRITAAQDPRIMQFGLKFVF
jgi:hypothetical protein